MCTSRVHILAFIPFYFDKYSRETSLHSYDAFPLVDWEQMYDTNLAIKLMLEHLIIWI
jgi:hypothetical protein